MRLVYSIQDKPIPGDYFYEATHTENAHFPQVPAHAHNFFEIYVYMRGSIRLAVEDKVFDVKRGDIIVIPPFCIHQLLPVHLNRPYERKYMYISNTCMKSLQFNEHSLLAPLMLAVKNGRYHFHISDENDYEQILNAMEAIYQSKKSDYYGKEMLNRSHLIQVLTLLGKHIIQDIKPRKTSSVNPVVEGILAYINEHYRDELTLDILAEHFYMNKFTITKLFKKHTSVTVHNYVLMKRISMAKQRMQDGVLATKVYLETGFTDYSTFYRAFVKSENMSPKDFFHIYSRSQDEAL